MDQIEKAVANPLLERLRIPGETFRLPSHGLFYESGELSPDVKNGEVEVYPMTAVDEIVLNTPDKLLSGRAIMEVFARCIPQIQKPDQLLSKDVDFLMVCLRMVSFGQFMEVNYHHNCEKGRNNTYSVDMQQMIRETKAIDPTTVKEEFTVTMPNGQVVVLKPMTYGNMVELYQTTALTKTDNISADEAEDLIVSTLVSVIKSVDGNINRVQIREWVMSIRLGWKKMLEKAAQEQTDWGVNFSTRQKCKDCGEELTIFVTANPVNFFM